MTRYDMAEARRYFQARTAFSTGVHELEELIRSRVDKRSYQVVDVRYPQDFVLGHVPGALNLPRGQWQNPEILSRKARLYLYSYCPTCHLAAEAAVELLEQGFRVIEVNGGWDTWVRNDFGIEVTPRSV